MNKKRFASLIILGLLVILFSGCTKSLPINYSEGINAENLNVVNKKSIGITKFKDNRSIAKSDNDKGQSFVATQSPWQFGLTYENENYCPVNKIVNRILYKEMMAAGFKVKNIDLIPANLEKQTLVSISQNESVDYILGGEILNFEFANDAGVWTVTSRQSVTLSLTLISSSGEVVFTNSTFSDSSSKNEGMGVLHSTNVDKLVNVVFKDVLKKVFKEISLELAINIKNIYLKVAINNLEPKFFMFKNEEFIKVARQQNLC